jgi:hypothetical protein
MLVAPEQSGTSRRGSTQIAKERKLVKSGQQWREAAVFREGRVKMYGKMFHLSEPFAGQYYFASTEPNAGGDLDWASFSESKSSPNLWLNQPVATPLCSRKGERSAWSYRS